MSAAAFGLRRAARCREGGAQPGVVRGGAVEGEARAARDVAWPCAPRLRRVELEDQPSARGRSDERQRAVGRGVRRDGWTARGAALIGAAALVPLLAFGVATTLGMGIGSIDNDGMGTPLSREEVRALTSRSGADAST